MIKTFKFRLYPTKRQKRILDFSFDESKFVYNSLLCVRKEKWEDHKKNFNKYDCNKLITVWKETRPQLYNIHSQVLQQISDRLDKAFKAFFRRVKTGEKAGYPRFKKDSFVSLCYPNNGKVQAFKYENNKLKLSKIGSIKIKVSRYFPKEIKNCIIKKSKTGKYYACFVCEVGKNILPKTDKLTAFDLGVQHFMHTAENEVVSNAMYLEQSIEKLKRIQRQFSKTKSPKHKRKLQLIFERIKNQRENFLHQESTRIIKGNDVIVHEDLNIKNMLEGSVNKNLNRNIGDVSWASLIQKLTYKAENAGRIIISVDPANTSRKCSNCGFMHADNRKDQEHFKCLQCGLELNADYNAALNIKALGMQSLALQTA